MHWAQHFLPLLSRFSLNFETCISGPIVGLVSFFNKLKQFQHCYSKAKSWHNCTQEIHSSLAEGESGIRQLHAAGIYQIVNHGRKGTFCHQDAHEFLIFLINHINEIIVGEQSQVSGNNSSKSRSSMEQEQENGPTWINEIFQVSKHWLATSANNLCLLENILLNP